MFSYKTFSKMLIAGSLVLVAAGCEKEGGMDGAGQTLVRLTGAQDTVMVFGMDLENKALQINVLEVTRSPHNETALNSPTVVKIKADPALITKINSSRKKNYEALPQNLWTLDPSVKLVNGFYEVTFAPGEISKYIRLTVNPSHFDLTKSYVLPFLLSEVTNGVATKGPHAALVNVLVKNQWDGLYAAKGTFIHPDNGPRDIDEDKELVTAGPNSVICNLGDLAANGYKMILTVNADNSVTIAPAGSTPNVDMNFGVNKYDPATKTFTLNYAYNTAAPRIIRETIARK